MTARPRGISLAVSESVRSENNMTEAAIIDEVARRLILGVQEELRAAHCTPPLDRELISLLYLRTRDALVKGGKPADDGAIDELALTMYLTISAWQSPTKFPVTILSSLRRHIANVLKPTQIGRSNA